PRANRTPGALDRGLRVPGDPVAARLGAAASARTGGPRSRARALPPPARGARLPGDLRAAGGTGHVAADHGVTMGTALRMNVVQLDEYRWMLPAEGGMRVPGVLFADRPLLEKMFSDKTPEQVKNAAHLPGILEASIAMPDAHWGYGLPV